MTKRIAVIGCGLRANSYLKLLCTSGHGSLQLVAVADPLAERRTRFVSEYGSPKCREFDSGPGLIAEVGSSLDGIIIASPNRNHLESALPAFRLGIPVLLEKPVAATRDDCRELWYAYTSAGRPDVLVGFVLRYSPFYRRIEEVVESGRIGKILSISAAELMGPSLTELFLRGWRRSFEVAGPLINEKCSHDLDVLSTIVGSIPQSASSVAQRSYFGPREGTGTHCRNCPIQAECWYDAYTLKHYSLSPEIATSAGGAGNTGKAGGAGRAGGAVNDECIFSAEVTIPDHQVVTLEYPGGIIGTLTVTMGQPRTTRTITICGTEGQITGVFEDDLFSITSYSAAGLQVDEEHIDHAGTPHGGGDTNIAAQFDRMVRGEAVQPPVGLEEGIQACLIGFAAESARDSGEGKLVERVTSWPQ